VQEALDTYESRRHFQYAYGINDGVNPVQETSGTTVLANILTGPGIDDFFTRTDVGAGVTSNLLTDALGSTVALADSSGAVQSENTYEPFGKTTATGVSNTNPFQYTGRENDGTGVYYYRARYYHPGLQRFIGEDPGREGLRGTPSRVSEALAFLTRGYQMDPDRVINDAVFTEDYEEMIVQKDIDFFSLCEHHLIPFFGKAHVGYIPHRKIVGVSKLARLVDVYARRLQVQERLTNQIATTIMEKLNPLGVAVVIEAEHLCMRMRGVEKQNSLIITSTLLGAFRNRQETRNEFMNLIRQRS